MRTRPITFSRPLVLRILDAVQPKTMTRRVITPSRGSSILGGPTKDQIDWQKAGDIVPFWNDAGRSEKWWTALVGTRNDTPPSMAICHFLCPYGVVGDHLRVNEDYRLSGFALTDLQARAATGGGLTVTCHYLADETEHEVTLTPAETVKLACCKRPFGIRPGRFMYASCSRILLELTGVRVERLQEISADDCFAEGFQSWICTTCHGTGTHPYGDECSCNGGHDPDEPEPQDWFRALFERLHGAGAWDANGWVWVLAFRRIEL